MMNLDDGSFTLVWLCEKCGREISTGYKNVNNRGRTKRCSPSIPSFCIWCKREEEKNKK